MTNNPENKTDYKVYGVDHIIGGYHILTSNASDSGCWCNYEGLVITNQDIAKREVRALKYLQSKGKL